MADPKRAMAHFSLSDVPQKPGVYMFLDKSDRILYVGKAKALRNRLSSYFNATVKTVKTERMLSRAADVKYIVTDNEIEAFLLEANLIKTEKPRYNILLKDSKGYPYVKLTGEEYPRMLVTRNTFDQNAAYFGPFVNAGDLRELVIQLLKSFPLRSCTARRFEKRQICLNYQIKRCLGPCEGFISHGDYLKLVDQMRRFFKGDVAEIRAMLAGQEKEAAGKLDFETAARLRDRIKSIENLFTRQSVVFSDEKRAIDVFVQHEISGVTGVTQMFVRSGKLIGTETHFFDDEPELLPRFVMQFYTNIRQFPEVLVLGGAEVPDEDDMCAALSRMAEKKIVMRHRAFKTLVELAEKNAQMQTELYLKRLKGNEDIYARLAELVGAEEPVGRIECIDISHLGGENTVGVSVVNEMGEAIKKDYRKYKIRSAENDDFQSIYELITRKGANVADGSEVPADLYIIDGGVGQLNAAVKAAADSGLEASFMGISKSRSIRGVRHEREESIEQLHIPGRKNPAIFKKNDPLLLFVQQVRDEAHRFAITYSRNLALKNVTKSPLLGIPGMGKKRLQKLLMAFPDIHTREGLTAEMLVKEGGLPQNLAEAVLEEIRQNG